MQFDQIVGKVGHLPFISIGNARYLYNLILEERLTRVLELGIAHGTATCYIAAANEELGGGTVTAVDLKNVNFRPTAEEQLERTGLNQFVELYRMQTGYSWFLHDEIKKLTKDGNCRPKNWTIDSGAFFCVDKILKEGGWIIFDDYYWTRVLRNPEVSATGRERCR